MNRLNQPREPMFHGLSAATEEVAPRSRMSQVLRPLACLPAALWLALQCAAPAQASQLVPQNLKQMIEKADVIVSGEVTKVSDGVQNGLPYTEVTMKVKGSVKRDLATNSSYTFRQYGLQKTRKMGDGRYMLATKIEGMPTWAVGEKVTTFMNKPATQSGFSTPVGLAQGKFTSSGAQIANSFNNKGLFQGMTVDPTVLNANEAEMLRRYMGSVEGGVLNNLVKRAVKEKWIEKGVMR